MCLGIRPFRYSTYRQNDVLDAINEGLGVKAVVLQCGATGLENIKNIRLCVDNKATKCIECSERKKSMCGKRV